MNPNNSDSASSEDSPAESPPPQEFPVDEEAYYREPLIAQNASNESSESSQSNGESCYAMFWLNLVGFLLGVAMICRAAIDIIHGIRKIIDPSGGMWYGIILLGNAVFLPMRREVSKSLAPLNLALGVVTVLTSLPAMVISFDSDFATQGTLKVIHSAFTIVPFLGIFIGIAQSCVASSAMYENDAELES